MRFQSTPLMRGETALLPVCLRVNLNFNPLPSCEGRLSWIQMSLSSWYFNPLPSCEGRRRLVAPVAKYHPFQSTPLMRGETAASGAKERISHFNPLPSCEGRRYGCAVCLFCKHFNPLPSCEGRRLTCWQAGARRLDFNPLPSCEGRR